MDIVSEARIAQRLREVPGAQPRVVVAGNAATPWPLVRLLDNTLERYRVFVMNPQDGWPCRPGGCWPR